MATQRNVPNELKEDDPFIICLAEKGKAMVVEDRRHIAKMQDQIHEGSHELTKNSEKAIRRKLHRKIVGQLVAVGIIDCKE